MKKIIAISLLIIGCSESPCGNRVSVKEFNKLQELKLEIYNESYESLNYLAEEADKAEDLMIGIKDYSALQGYRGDVKAFVKARIADGRRDIIEEYNDFVVRIRDSITVFFDYKSHKLEELLISQYDSIQLIQDCIIANSTKAYIDFDKAKNNNPVDIVNDIRTSNESKLRMHENWININPILEENGWELD
mgnify:CR=1 FL=1